MPDQDLIEVNLSRDITIRDEDGGVSTYGPGLTKVPPKVAYTVALRPEYIATDAQGVPLKNTIEQLSEFASRHVHSMPAPDVAYARGQEFATDPIERPQLEGQPTGADRQGGRIEAVASDSPLTDPETQHFPLPGQREHSPAQRAQLSQDVRRAEVERDGIASDRGQSADEIEPRISEHARTEAEAHEESTASEDAEGAFSRFAGDSESHETSDAQGGAYATEGGDPTPTSGSKGSGGSGGAKRAAKRGGAKKSRSSKRGASKRGSAAKRSSSARKTTKSTDDDE